MEITGKKTPKIDQPEIFKDAIRTVNKDPSKQLVISKPKTVKRAREMGDEGWIPILPSTIYRIIRLK